MNDNWFGLFPVSVHIISPKCFHRLFLNPNHFIQLLTSIRKVTGPQAAINCSHWFCCLFLIQLKLRIKSMLRINGTICISIHDVLCQCIQREREAHIKAHCPPTLSPFAPVTHSGLGLQPMNEGWFLGGSALLLPGVDQLWSWVGATVSCQVLQREMDEPLWWLLGIGWWGVSRDWWVYTAPPAPWVKLVHPHQKTTILSWGSYMMRRKGES